ncbi:amidohydrolase family protein [Pseudooceanicola spongiae]|uniref:Amidohydrolase family protein n=1 Tax=Pseudooceanicola spongiae TaxID=2613965 RepID=A0A7L9WSS5_9RHOB|nr:amidohydrolase family protein [Pseudooceanicola spongiae]QOL82486.1 amidohydrolase family protein [Pseudooceanicola spongiae]
MSLPTLPARGDYVLRNALIPASLAEGLPGHDCASMLQNGLILTDIAVRGGRFHAPDPAATLPAIDLGQRILLPRFVDMHTHLDKAYTVERTGFSRDGLSSAVALWSAGQGARSVADDIARMERSLIAAEAHGTRALRTHLDTIGHPDDNTGWQAYGEVAPRWKGRIELQAVALTALFRVEEPDFPARCAAIAARGGILGAFIDRGGATPALMQRLLSVAAVQGLDLDLHVDETLDPAANGLEMLATWVLKTGFRGRVVAGHCCALAQMAPRDRDRVIALVAEAGIEVVALPATNGFLQDRSPDRTGLLRGLAPVQELAAAGVPVSFASDNVRDAFYPYGAYDPLEAQRLGLFMGQLEGAPEEWIAATTATPARAMGLADIGRLKAGAAADAVLFDAHDWADLFSGTALSRCVLHNGAPLTTAQPVLEREPA